jgi:hypothetical protein
MDWLEQLEHMLPPFFSNSVGAMNRTFFDSGSLCAEQNKGRKKSNPYTALFRQVSVLQIVGIYYIHRFLPPKLADMGQCERIAYP